METLKSLKNRTATVETIMKATSAMKMVSTIKLSRVNSSNRFAKDCTTAMQEIFSILLNQMIFEKLLSKNHWLNPNREGKSLIVVISPNSSFCGAFTQSINVTTKNVIANNHEAKVICFGEKVKIADAEYLQILEKDNIEYVANKLSSKIIDIVMVEAINKIIVVSGKYENAIVQSGQISTLFPTSPKRQHPYVEIEENLCVMLERVFMSYVRHAMLWLVSEHMMAEFSARLIATDNATRNAKDLSESLHMLYNRTRQSKITQELIEIVSSVECMK